MKPTRTRIATLRAIRRRNTELPPPAALREPEPLPPLESPDEDREFLPHPHALVLNFEPIPRPDAA